MDFIRSKITCEWCLISLISQIALAPVGTQACAFDIKAFHRTCPVHPDHKPYLVVSVRGEFYIDHNHPFGARPASSNSGQIANAAVDILEAAGEQSLSTFKYEDDMSNLRYPTPSGTFQEGSYRYAHDRDSCMELIGPLQVLWHPVKTGLRFSFTMIFIGFFWDLIQRRVSLPEPKRLKFLGRVLVMLRKVEHAVGLSLLEVEKIHGSLVHICFVYREGSSRLPPVSNFMARFNGDEFMRRQGSNSLAKALIWWKHQLSSPGYFRQLRPLGPVVDMGIFVDASTTWGIGNGHHNRTVLGGLRPCSGLETVGPRHLLARSRCA